MAITLVTDQFIKEFPLAAAHASGLGFWKGLL